MSIGRGQPGPRIRDPEYACDACLVDTLLDGAFGLVVTPVYTGPSPPTGITNGTQMAHYFVDNDASMDGTHHVHAAGCSCMPADKRYLGNFFNVGEALIEARKDFWLSSGCEKCSHSDTAATDTVRQLRVKGRAFA